MRFSTGTARLSKKSSVVAWLIMVRMGRMVRPFPIASRMSTSSTLMPSVGFFDSSRGVVRHKQKHQVGMFGAADPDLLAVDDVAVALAPREGADARRVGAAGRLGDAERLQPEFA